MVELIYGRINELYILILIESLTYVKKTSYRCYHFKVIYKREKCLTTVVMHLAVPIQH